MSENMIHVKTFIKKSLFNKLSISLSCFEFLAVTFYGIAVTFCFLCSMNARTQLIASKNFFYISNPLNILLTSVGSQSSSLTAS